MEKSTKKGLVAVGITASILAIAYYIFNKMKQKPLSNTSTNTSSLPIQENDPYSIVDKATKIQAIKDYLKSNATDLQKSAYAIGLDPIWTFSDTYAKGSNEGVNAWYYAIQKNQPTFSFYNKVILGNQIIDTKTGQKI
jgi:hypothetical protein